MAPDRDDQRFQRPPGSLGGDVSAQLESIVRAAEREALVVEREIAQRRRGAEEEIGRYLAAARLRVDAEAAARAARLETLSNAARRLADELSDATAALGEELHRGDDELTGALPRTPWPAAAREPAPQPRDPYADEPFAAERAQPREPFDPRDADHAREPFAPRAAEPFAPRAADHAREPFAPRAAEPFAPRAADHAREPFAPRAADHAREPFSPRAAEPFAPHAAAPDPPRPSWSRAAAEPAPLEPSPEPTPLRIAEPPAPEPPRPPAPSGEMTNAARLVAIEMAVGGASRADVDEHLRSRFGVDDPSPLLDDVFGAESHPASRLAWGEP